MKLLIVTQKVDENDDVLGFFHRWLQEFAKHFEFITVIALGVGRYQLPANVKVFSLGKETGRSRLKYLFNFYRYIWRERKNYDAVFVHMNQEYVLLAGWWWRLVGKKIYLWRNHAKGSFLTRLAVWLSNQVFCTSPQAFTARFAKAKLMPVGVDTEFFKPNPAIQKKPNSILFLGRIAPVKKVLEFVDWLKSQKFDTATIAGSALGQDAQYEREVRERISKYGLDSKVKLVGAVTQDEAKGLYQSHEIYANFTPAGSMDKTIIEAAACGARLEVRNPDLKDFRVEDHSLKILMDKLKKVIE